MGITSSRYHETGAGYWSPAEGIDTLTPKGRLVFNVFASIEAFGREGFSADRHEHDDI